MDGEVKVKEVPGAVNGSNKASMAGRTSGTPSRLKFLRHCKPVLVTRKDGKRQYIAYNWYECSCGEVKRIMQRHVDEGKIKSCGCLRIEIAMRNLEKAHETNKREGYKGIRPNVGNINGVNKNGKCKGQQDRVLWHYKDGTKTYLPVDVVIGICNGTVPVPER